MNKKLDEVISYITNSSNYKKCIQIKEKMITNEEICRLVEEIKTLQKQYVRSGYLDDDIKLDLELKEARLNEIPIYVEYMNNLGKVNEMITLVKDELNDYFSDLLSIEIEND